MYGWRGAGVGSRESVSQRGAMAASHPRERKSLGAASTAAARGERPGFGTAAPRWGAAHPLLLRGNAGLEVGHRGGKYFENTTRG